MKRNDVSWPSTSGERLYGRFIRWDGEYAICKRGPTTTRIHKSNLTFERD